MSDTMAISSAMQDYLEVILELSEREAVVRVTDIAAQLNIAKASVAQAVGKLKELGLVLQENYGPVELTASGRKAALQVQQWHRTLRLFLVEVLGVDPVIAEKDACLMEHAVSSETMEKLVEFLKAADHIKNSVNEGGIKAMESLATHKLSEMHLGDQGKVTRIVAAGSARRRILEMGVTPGTDIYVKGMAPLGDPMEILVKGYRLSLRKEEAENIIVEVQ